MLDMAYMRAHIGHVEHLCDIFDGGPCQPAFLFLRAPQDRNDRRGLAAFGEFFHLRLGPGQIGIGKGKGRGLVVVKAA